MAEVEQILFGPTNDKDLKRQYPELKEIAEFDKLTTGELLFVWWYSNSTSPIVKDENLSEKQRSMKAYYEAFKSHPNEDRQRDYYSLNFPDKVRLAIDRMRKFEPTVRIRSKMISETILENFEKMSKVDMSDFEEIDPETNIKTINWTGRNNYVTSAKTILQTLPDLIRQVEEGFGVKDRKGSDNNGEKAIDRFHQTKND